MRLHLRPDYLFRRFSQRISIALSVRRSNREAADAFRHPVIDSEPTIFFPSFSRNPSLKFLLPAIAASVVSFLVMTKHHGKEHLDIWPASESASLSQVSAVPVAADPAKASAQPVTAIPVPADAPVATTAPSPVEPPAAEASPSSLPALATPVQEVEVRPATLPEKGRALIACKRDRTLYVYTRNGKGWDKTAAFPMAFGRKAGDKADAGDLRTPEGRYWIINMFPGPAKGPMYGSLVFTLNYPDPADQAEGKTGQGIWIHGVEAGKLPNFTHGCLSLSNEDMVALSAYADVGTPVVIVPDSALPNPARQLDLEGMQREYPAIMAAHARKTASDSAAREKTLAGARDFVAKEAKDFPELDMQAPSEKEQKAILARIEKWREDWSSRKLDAYASNYDSDFRDAAGHDRSSFLDRKGKIFATKSKINMEIGEPHIEPEGYSRVKVSFRQDYLAEGAQGAQRSSGQKTLRLEDGPSGWLIISE